MEGRVLMNPLTARNAMKTIACIAVAVIFGLCQPAFAGSITGGFTSLPAQEVDLESYNGTPASDWAIWGMNANDGIWASNSHWGSLGGSVSHPIDYTLTNISNGNPFYGVGPQQTGNSYLPGGVYGGLMHDQTDPGRARNKNNGFEIKVRADGTPMKVNVWGDSYQGTTKLSVFGSGVETPFDTTYGTLANVSQPFMSSYDLVGVTGEVKFRFTLADDASSFARTAGLRLSAAQVLEVSDVPEFGGSPIGALIAALCWLSARKRD
jgi:hypothetical protein